MGEHDSRSRSSMAATESVDRPVDDVLDDLLVALRSDQGGARTDAIKRALERESGPSDEVTERIATLESAVGKLLHAVDTELEDDGNTEPSLEDVRADLDSTIDELTSLRATVDSLESTDTALEARVGDLEARLADLEDRIDDELRTDDLEARIANDARTGDLAARIDALETTVTEVADRLATVEAATRADPSDSAAARDPLDVEDSDGTQTRSEVATDQAAAPVAKRIQHVERKLDTRTTALASRIRDIERLETRIDDLDDRLDERTAALETELEDVTATMQEAITLLQEGTKSELSAVQSELEDLDELRSSIDALAADVDALEAHAADMTLWRNSIEGEPDVGAGHENETQ